MNVNRQFVIDSAIEALLAIAPGRLDGHVNHPLPEGFEYPYEVGEYGYLDDFEYMNDLAQALNAQPDDAMLGLISETVDQFLDRADPILTRLQEEDRLGFNLGQTFMLAHERSGNGFTSEDIPAEDAEELDDIADDINHSFTENGSVWCYRASDGSYKIGCE